LEPGTTSLACARLIVPFAPSALKGGKRDVYCDKQIEEAVTVLNCMLKGSWGEGGSGGIKKKLKSGSTTYL